MRLNHLLLFFLVLHICMSCNALLNLDDFTFDKAKDTDNFDTNNSDSETVPDTNIKINGNAGTNTETDTKIDTDSGDTNSIELNPCDTVVCNYPPPDYCVGDELFSHDRAGICKEDGECTYQVTRQICFNGCSANGCYLGCTPGATRCNENILELCDDSGIWALLETCTYACDAAAWKCMGECNPGDTRCERGEFEFCDNMGIWIATSTCTAGGCCSAFCDWGFGCYTQAGTCADACGNTTLSTDQVCQGCGVDGAMGNCAGGTSTVCSESLACKMHVCGNVQYHCRLSEGSWQWQLTDCTIGSTCKNGICTGECTNKDTRCVEDDYQECVDYSWQTIEVCPFSCATSGCIMPEMISCDGGKLDEVTNLCWYDFPSANTLNWHQALQYCNSLDHGNHSNWRLPNINELISLIRGCRNGIATLEQNNSLCKMSPTECIETDTFCSDSTSCTVCLSGSGTSTDGCYWDPVLTGACLVGYWSSSPSALNHEENAWHVDFLYGYVNIENKIENLAIRCVRDVP